MIRRLHELMSNHYVNTVTIRFGVFFLTFANAVILTRYLGPALRGEYAYINNIAIWVVMIANFGLYQAYPQLKKTSEPDIKRRFTNIVFFQFFFYILIALMLSVYSEFDYEMVAVAFLIPFMTLTQQLNFITIIENVNKRNLISLISQIVHLGILLLCYFLVTPSIIQMISIVILWNIVEIFFYVVTFRMYDEFSIFNVDLRLMWRLICKGFIPMLSLLLATANYSIDIIMLKWKNIDFINIGYYAVAVGLGKMIWMIPDAFKEVLFARTVNKDCVDEIGLGIKINLIIASLVILTFWPLGKWVLVILYGPEFINAYQSSMIIFVASIPMVFFKLLRPAFLIKGKDYLSLLTLSISAILNIGLNLVLIPMYGINGAAISSLVSYSVCGFMYLAIFSRINKVPIYDFFIITKMEINKINHSISKAR